MPDAEVGYVIADYGTPRLAAAARASVLQHNPGAQALIVDAKRLGLGYSEALNAGLRRDRLVRQRPAVVCFLNADVEMLGPDHAVRHLFEYDPELAIVGPRQVDADARVAHGGIVPYEDGTPWDLDLRHRCHGWPLADADLLTDGTFEVPMVPGSVLYARRDVVEALGGWPEWTRFYYEDMWLCYAARHRGWRVLYTGAATWRHLGQSSPVPAAWRDEAMATARAAFAARCRAEGVPLREEPPDELAECG